MILNYSYAHGSCPTLNAEGFSVFYLKKMTPSSLKTGVLFRYLTLITKSV